MSEADKKALEFAKAQIAKLDHIVGFEVVGFEAEPEKPKKPAVGAKEAAGT